MPGLNYYNLQKAIYEKLIGNVPLTALINGVFDYTPQGIEFPYITIGELSSADRSNLSKRIVEQQINIHIWSRDGGHKQSADIMELVYGLLNNGSISISGQTVNAMQFTGTSIQLENDASTYHGIMHLKIILTEN